MAKIGSFRCGDGIKTGTGWQLDPLGGMLDRLLTQRDHRLMQVSLRVDALDAAEHIRPAIDLTGHFIQGSISYDGTRDIQRTCNADMQFLDTINYLADRFLPYYRFLMPDNVYFDLPLGVYLWQLPTETISPRTTTVNLTANDKCSVLKDYKLTSHKLVKEGSHIFDAIVQLGYLAEGNYPTNTYEVALQPPALNTKWDFPRLPRGVIAAAYYCGLIFDPVTGLQGAQGRLRAGSLKAPRCIWRASLSFDYTVGSSVSTYTFDTDSTIAGANPLNLRWVDDWHADLFFSTTASSGGDGRTFSAAQLANLFYRLTLHYNDGTEDRFTDATDATLPIIDARLMTVPVDTVFDAGKPALDIVNELLTAVSWERVYFNRIGQLCMKPLDSNLPELYPAVLYDTGRWSIVLDPTTRQFDTTSLANRVTVIGEKVDQDQVTCDFVDDRGNHANFLEITDLENPLHKKNLGRVITRVVKEDKLAFTESANALAAYYLLQSSMVGETVTLKTVVDPRRDCYEVYHILVTQNGLRVIDNAYQAKSWTLPLKADEMQHVAAKITAINDGSVVGDSVGPIPPPPTTTGTGYNPAADFNHDGVIDIFDYSILANNWGRRGNNLSGDANLDGIVNAADYTILAQAWGTHV